MIREGDHVRLSSGADGYVRTVNASGLVVVVSDLRDVIERDSDLVILCAMRPCEDAGDHWISTKCPNVATKFDRRTGDAVCSSCASWAFARGELTDVRVEAGALVPCACGEDLARGKSHGVWTLGDAPVVACEYRTCVHCHSTRAYGPRDVLSGRFASVVDEADPDDPRVVHEAPSFVDLLSTEPPSSRSVIVRNGVTLARAFTSHGGAVGWRVESPSREEPIRV